MRFGKFCKKAASDKHLVVLQVKTEKVGSFETVTGWIVGKRLRERTSRFETAK